MFHPSLTKNTLNSYCHTRKPEQQKNVYTNKIKNIEREKNCVPILHKNHACLPVTHEESKPHLTVNHSVVHQVAFACKCGQNKTSLWLKMQQSSMLLASPHTWPCLPFDRLYTIFTTENLNSDFVL